MASNIDPFSEDSGGTDGGEGEHDGLGGNIQYLDGYQESGGGGGGGGRKKNRNYSYYDDGKGNIQVDLRL
jgi:hypothetical protein